MARVGAVAYRLSLPQWLRGIHPTFHVGLLKKHSVGGDGRSPEGPRPILVDGQQEWKSPTLLGSVGLAVVASTWLCTGL